MEIETLKVDPFSVAPLVWPDGNVVPSLAELCKVDRERVEPDEIHIPDLWHIVDYLYTREPRAALAVFQAWIIALDLLNALRHVESKQR